MSTTDPVELYKEGHNITEVARVCDLSRMTVYSRLRDAGVKLRHREPVQYLGRDHKAFV